MILVSSRISWEGTRLEDNSVLGCFQRSGRTYDLFQELVGANMLRRKFVASHVRAMPGDKIVDIGCGPGQLIRWLPPVEYAGFDINKAYIDRAKKIYGHLGLFLAGDVRSAEDDGRFMNADVAVCFCVLHHLDDEEVLEVMEFARKTLKPDGRLVCEEPCWMPDQGFFSKMIMSNDRGKNIRTEQDYLKLMKKAFPDIKTALGPKVVRLPIITMTFECKLA